MVERAPAGEILWAPTATQRAGTTAAAFAALARERYGLTGAHDDYWALHRWSIEDLPRFWTAVADFFGVALGPGAETPLVLGAEPVAGARWFPGASVSYVEHALRGRADDEVALVAASEAGPPDRALTWGELRQATAALACALADAGVGPGDRVAGYLPNVPETAIAFLATASLGAVWSCCSPDFGEQAVVDRFAQIEPKVLVAVDRYRYGGREFDRSDTLAAIRASLDVELTILLDGAADGGPGATLAWDEALARGAGATLEPAAVPFEHPLWILYSSGTTGLPKPIVHSHGGILLEHLKWLGLHVDAQLGDRVFWLTTTGWTMWNFVVGALLVGAAPVLYDGNPGHPGMEALWEVAERAGATCFGAGASYYAACMRAGVGPRDGRGLAALRAVGSTGSPLAPEAFDWIYEQLGPDVWLFSTSGGTDVCTAFVGGAPLLPVRRGELQAPALGVDVQAWDEDGRELAGGVGELVVTQPMPSMPVRFWADDDGSRLRDAYFDAYPGYWRHGDWIEFTASGGAIVHGRSDATINRGGVRIGTAEIYRAVLALPEVEDAVVVDVPRPGAESWMPLFVVLAEGRALDTALAERIRARVRAACSPRHVPEDVVEAPAVPRTLTGKALEVPLKRLLTGEPVEAVASRDSLANPEALDWFARFAAQAQNSRTSRRNSSGASRGM